MWYLVLAGGISVQLTTNIYHVSRIAEKILKVGDQTSVLCVRMLEIWQRRSSDSVASRLSCNFAAKVRT